MTDTADNIARLDTLATKGPWTFEAFNEILAGEDTCDAMLLGGDGETIVAQCLAERDWPLIATLRNAVPEILSALRLAEPDFQDRVDAWVDACFGDTIKTDKLERADRFCEEALELCQTMPGFSGDRAHASVAYVFGRPVGETSQEVGGVMVTLAALCNTLGLPIAEAAETELARVWTKVEQIRAKQVAKPTGSALPIATPAEPSGDVATVTQVDRKAALDFLTSEPWLDAFSHGKELDATAAAFARYRLAKRPELRIGQLTLRQGYGGPGAIEIAQLGGEAGDFPIAEVEALLQAYYQEKF